MKTLMSKTTYFVYDVSQRSVDDLFGCRRLGPNRRGEFEVVEAARTKESKGASTTLVTFRRTELGYE